MTWAEVLEKVRSRCSTLALSIAAGAAVVFAFLLRQKERELHQQKVETETMRDAAENAVQEGIQKGHDEKLADMEKDRLAKRARLDAALHKPSSGKPT